jgi:hypothetical protein
VKRLGILAKEVDLPNVEQVHSMCSMFETLNVDQARQNIEKYSELVEKDILNVFDQALKDGDVATLCVLLFDPWLSFARRHCYRLALVF